MKKNNLLKGMKFAKITLPSTITSIEPNSFMDCDNLYGVILPSSLKSIGFNAFKNCLNLMKINFLSSVASLDSTFFDGCRNLEEITIEPFSIKIVGNSFLNLKN